MSVFTNFETAIMQSVIAAVPPDQSVVPPRVECKDGVVWNLSGFDGRARVGTTFGDLPIAALRVRDELRTASGKTVRVQWTDKLHLDADFLTKHPSANPISFPANSLSFGRPMQDLVISPQQQISPEAHVATHFKTAIELCSRAKAQQLKSTGLTYYRFHCGEPVTVRVEGVWVRIEPEARYIPAE